MEEDKLLRFHERLKDFLQKHLTLLLNIVLGLVLLIMINGAWVYYQKNKDKKAFEEFTNIIHKGRDLKSLREFVKKYGRTTAGSQAILILWNTSLHKGDVKDLKEELSNLKSLYRGKAEGLTFYAEAKILEEEGKMEEAFKLYSKALEKETLLKGSILFDQARIKERQNKSEAIKLYQELLKETESSYLRGLIEFKLFQLQRS
ncbi:MAG: tetratricopeptide repeat protein [Caldimicrobium sp.]|nr:tetratricopeptide repeat protein [Caldimicrobium sp.]MDW8183579.1 tetratricopeptide repeat protein [Caldimicrobium sp.]